MHTDSSASSTCFWLKSAVECTATVLMPSSRQARKMRSAISPRFAITTLSSMVCHFLDKELFDDKQRLAEFDRIAVLDQDRRDTALLVGLDLIHHLHRFDDAQCLADFDLRANFDKRFGTRRSGGIESTHHRCCDYILRSRGS